MLFRSALTINKHWARWFKGQLYGSQEIIQMNDDEIIFEPIEITETDLIDISEEEYTQMLQVEEEALNEFLEDLRISGAVPVKRLPSKSNFGGKI